MTLLPHPHLTQVYRLEATVGEPLDVGDIAQGGRRIIPRTGGTFTGPKVSGTLVRGVSADWQIETASLDLDCPSSNRSDRRGRRGEIR